MRTKRISKNAKMEKTFKNNFESFPPSHVTFESREHNHVIQIGIEMK